MLLVAPDDWSGANRGFRPAFATSETTVARARSIEKWWEYIPPVRVNENTSDYRETLDSPLC